MPPLAPPACSTAAAASSHARTTVTIRSQFCEATLHTSSYNSDITSAFICLPSPPPLSALSAGNFLSCTSALYRRAPPLTAAGIAVMTGWRALVALGALCVLLAACPARGCTTVLATPGVKPPCTQCDRATALFVPGPAQCADGRIPRPQHPAHAPQSQLQTGLPFPHTQMTGISPFLRLPPFSPAPFLPSRARVHRGRLGDFSALK